jgi:UDP-glucose 4-epimerase
MRYLVTGGTGFIGSALVKRLVVAGHHVSVMDDGSRGAWSRLEGLPYDRIKGDVRDYQLVRMAASRIDRVVHLAAINGTKHFYERPWEVLDVGIRGTLNVIDACHHHGVRELFVASSSEVYQEPPVVPTPEGVPLVVPDLMNPRYSYGGSKIASELMAIHSGLPRVVIFRPHNVYGPDMGREHVIPEFIERALTLRESGGTMFRIHGDGTQRRAFVHIDDFTDALQILLARGEHRTVYHIGTRQPFMMKTLAVLVCHAVGMTGTVPIEPTDAPSGETTMRAPDISRLAQLGYAPRVIFTEGLRETVEWYTAHREFPR